MRPRQFCKGEILRKIGFKNLIDFLTPYSGYFHERGFDLPPDPSQSEFNYDKLASILLDPSEATPPDMVEALHYINDLCTEEGFDALQEAIEGSGLELVIPDDVTVADLAILLWKIDRRIVERVHAEAVIMKTSSFAYFKSEEVPETKAMLPSQESLSGLEGELNEFFRSKRRGATAKISMVTKGDAIWFLIRHGEPLRRESTIKDGQSVAVIFRPEKTDVVVYNRAISEIRIRSSSRSKRLIEFYRERFGNLLFGNKDFFGNQSIFTLDPLRADGESSLVCKDVPGLQDVRLTEVQLYYGGGSQHHTVIHRAEDLFNVLQGSPYNFLRGGHIRKASFRLTFDNAKLPRTLSVCNGNRAQFKRDDDAELVEKWLALRGFITVNHSENLCA
jgi:hypothetical protein